MATGTVSALEPNQWQLISSAAATSQTTVSFTSLSGYKQYRLVYISTGGNIDVALRFNSDTGTNYYSNTTRGSSNGDTNATAIQLNTVDTSTAYWYNGYVDIFDADKPIEKTVEGHGSYYMGNVFGGWQNTDAITTISITAFGPSSTFAGGTFKLYGIAS